MNIFTRNEAELNGKSVCVIGAGTSGIAASRLLRKVGAKVFLSDSNEATSQQEQLVELRAIDVEMEFGTHSEKIYEADMMVVSPGVPQDAETILAASEKGIPVVSEVELASWYTKLPILAVTGSNGKTTTTSIVAEMCLQGDFTPFLAGNIGIPFSRIVYENFGNEPKNGIHVLEISSFQMEHIQHFRPKIAILLNITADHLDRYPSMEEYATAKMRITENMTEEDTVIYNIDDPLLNQKISTSAKLIPFTLHESPDAFFSINETKIYDEVHEILIYQKDISLPGRHNIANFLAAATACKVLGLTTENIRQVMLSFRGVPHRLEYVTTIYGIQFYNDSKATNIESVKVALDSFSGPVILIMGGRDKGADFRELLPFLAGKVKRIIVLGEAADRIKEVLSITPSSIKAHSIESAVSLAHRESKAGDTVLLSPGCASFDMFRNFEERGDVFRRAVNNLRRSA